MPQGMYGGGVVKMYDGEVVPPSQRPSVPASQMYPGSPMYEWDLWKDRGGNRPDLSKVWGGGYEPNNPRESWGGIELTPFSPEATRELTATQLYGGDQFQSAATDRALQNPYSPYADAPGEHSMPDGQAGPPVELMNTTDKLRNSTDTIDAAIQDWWANKLQKEKPAIDKLTAVPSNVWDWLTTIEADKNNYDMVAEMTGQAAEGSSGLKPGIKGLLSGTPDGAPEEKKGIKTIAPGAGNADKSVADADKDSQLSDANGAAVQGSKKSAADMLLELGSTDGIDAPDFSGLSDQARQRGWGAALTQLGAGIAGGDIAKGLENAGNQAASDSAMMAKIGLAEQQGIMSSQEANMRSRVAALGSVAQVQAAQDQYRTAMANQAGQNARAVLNGATEQTQKRMVTDEEFNNMTDPVKKAARRAEIFREEVMQQSITVGIDPRQTIELLKIMQAGNIPLETPKKEESKTEMLARYLGMGSN